MHFLEKFRGTITEPKKNRFYLSAFLAAWRSVIDFILYDFAECYGLEYYEKLKVHQLAKNFKHARIPRTFAWA